MKRIFQIILLLAAITWGGYPFILWTLTVVAVLWLCWKTELHMKWVYPVFIGTALVGWAFTWVAGVVGTVTLIAMAYWFYRWARDISAYAEQTGLSPKEAWAVCYDSRKGVFNAKCEGARKGYPEWEGLR